MYSEQRWVEMIIQYAIRQLVWVASLCQCICGYFLFLKMLVAVMCCGFKKSPLKV